MRRAAAVAVALALAASGLVADDGGQWPTFHYDAARRGHPPVRFKTCAFDEAWRFDLGGHTWRYEKGTSVWSASPAIAQVGGRTLLFIGAYDHNLYALDAATGEEVWRLTTGGRLNAPPAVARVGERTLVFIGSGDRTFYAADAATGEKLWSHETLPWSYTTGVSAPTAPVVVDIGGRTLVAVGFWNTDRRALRTIQRSDVFAFDAATGEVVWRRKLADTPITSPAMMPVDGRPLLFIGAEDGRLMALRATDGALQWTFTSDHAITAAPMAAALKGQPAVFVGNRWGMLNCVSAKTGALLWSSKTGHEIKSTAAIAPVEGRMKLYVGSMDRYLHCIDASTSRSLWRFQTGKFVVSSPVVCEVAGKPAVIFSSLDNRLYMRDALSGQKIWQFETGDMLWPYETRGSSLWSSPAVAEVDGEPQIFFGSYDGNLYCFKAVPRCFAEGQDLGPRPGATPAREEGSRSRPLVFLPPILGLGMIVAGFAVMLTSRGRSSDAGAGDDRC
ncbi:MAG: PQQ-binding-like beta-propeller repeat protein [Armatimonadota bacterium]|nr:PQQ-binding-like beta-propeller repeat protein [Armatimonadota bacterium]